MRISLLAYRVDLVGCHNDVKVPWPKFEYCPHKDNYEDKYECSKKISAMQVIEKIDELLRIR